MSYEALIGVMDDAVTRNTSSWLSKLTKKLRKHMGGAGQFKQLWRTLRSGIDAAAAMAGVSVEELRRQFGNRGVDATAIGEAATYAFEQATDSGGNLDMTADQINDVWKQTEESSKDGQASSPDMKLILYAAVALFVLPKLLGGSGGRSRGRARGRKRSFRRRFR